MSKESDRKTEAMMHAALVLGFNELAKRAETMGDRLYFRLFREQAHAKLREMGDTGWSLEFAESEPPPPVSP